MLHVGLTSNHVIDFVHEISLLRGIVSNVRRFECSI